MSDYLLRVMIAIDQFFNVAVCNGNPDETMSSVAWRMECDGHFWGFMRPVIDTLFRYWGPDHCQHAYESELSQRVAGVAPRVKKLQ